MADRLEDIIAEHHWGLSGVGPDDTIRCGCGARFKVKRPGTSHATWSAHVAETIREAHTIRTIEELDELPRGAIVEHDGKVLRNRKFIGLFQEINGEMFDHDSKDVLPCLLVWTPEGGK